MTIDTSQPLDTTATCHAIPVPANHTQLQAYLRLADVSCKLEALPAFLFDQLNNLVSVLVLVKVQDGHISALTRQVHRNGTADARITTCVARKVEAIESQALSVALSRSE
jgi:tRNA A22 N-methylase